MPEEIIGLIHKGRKLAKGGRQRGAIKGDQPGFGIDGQQQGGGVGVAYDDFGVLFEVSVINVGQNRVGVVPADGSHEDLHVRRGTEVR